MKRRLVPFVLAMLVLLGLAAFALAAPTPADNTGPGTGGTAPSGTLQSGILIPSVYADFNGPITRAELVKIIVNSFKMSDDAIPLSGAAAFPDTVNHWASGEIALAKKIIEANGASLGYPNGTFYPDRNVTSAEAVVFVMKFIGIKPNSNSSWPTDYLQGALDAGLINADDNAALSAFPNSAAGRGLVFYLADKTFTNYTFPNTDNIYQPIVPQIEPKPVTAEPVKPTQVVINFKLGFDEKIDEYNITGTVKTTDKDSNPVPVTGDTNLDITVNGFKADSVTIKTGESVADLDGTWSMPDISLAIGENEIFIHAVDLAGDSQPAAPIAITRIQGAVSAIRISPIADVKVGETQAIDAVAVDKNGVVIANVPLEIESNSTTAYVAKIDVYSSTYEFDATNTIAETVTYTVKYGEFSAQAQGKFLPNSVVQKAQVSPYDPVLCKSIVTNAINNVQGVIKLVLNDFGQVEITYNGAEATWDNIVKALQNTSHSISKINS